jgi:hypothetical protein
VSTRRLDDGDDEDDDNDDDDDDNDEDERRWQTAVGRRQTAMMTIKRTSDQCDFDGPYDEVVISAFVQCYDSDWSSSAAGTRGH